MAPIQNYINGELIAPTKGNLLQINKDIPKLKKAMIICFKFRAGYK